MTIQFRESSLPGHEGRLGLHMHVFTGKFVFPCDLREGEVDIRDIAHHLSMQCRFAGATIDFVSVAEHSWIASYFEPEVDPLEKLMHDAAETYIQDWIRPIKYLPELAPIYRALEEPIEKVIAKKFGLKYPFPPSVKRADETVVTMEVRDNIANPDKGTLHEEMAIPPHIKLKRWSPKKAEAMFLKRFKELTIKRALTSYGLAA